MLEKLIEKVQQTHFWHRMQYNIVERICYISVGSILLVTAIICTIIILKGA